MANRRVVDESAVIGGSEPRSAASGRPQPSLFPTLPGTKSANHRRHHQPLTTKPARRAGEVLGAPTHRAGSRLAHPASMRSVTAHPRRRCYSAYSRTLYRRSHRRSGPLASFSPVLERAGSKVGRRAIVEGGTERALDSGPGSTTPARKRAGQGPRAHCPMNDSVTSAAWTDRDATAGNAWPNSVGAHVHALP